MRRTCTTLAIVSSLLVAAGPAQAEPTANARVGAKQACFAPQPAAGRIHKASRMHGCPYGRT